MKKILIFASVALATLVSTSSLFAASYSFNASTLEVIQGAVVDNHCTWTFNLTCASTDKTKSIQLFQVGLRVDDTNGTGIGNTTAGHYKDYTSSFTSAVANEGSVAAEWSGFSLFNGQSATFGFTTDLLDSSFTTDMARDNRYAVSFEDKATPAPAVPEPGSLVALLCGCVGLFARFRK